MATFEIPSRRWGEEGSFMHRRLLPIVVASTIVLGFLAPSKAESQVLIALLFGDKLSTERAQFGLNVSAGLTGLTGVSSRFDFGWAIGLYLEIALRPRIHLLPELVMKMPAGARDMDSTIPGYSIDTLGDPALGMVEEQGSVQRSMTYLALSVVARFALGPIGLGVGPQGSIRTQRTELVSLERGDQTVTIETSSGNFAQRWDAGLLGTLDFPFSPHLGMRSVRLRAKGYYGLVDTVKGEGGPAMRNWYFLLGVDIPIGGPPRPPPDAGKSGDV